MDPTWVFNIANKFMKRNRHKLAMPHDATGMALMQDPSQWFGKVIRGIDDTSDELHHNVPTFVFLEENNTVETYGAFCTRKASENRCVYFLSLQ